MRFLVAGLFALGLAACSDARDVSGSSATGVTASGWQTSLPAYTSDATVVTTLSLRGCDFAVGTATLTPPQPQLDGGISPPPVPPVFLAFVQRGIGQHGPRWCTPGFVVYGASASPGVEVDVAAKQGRPFLVVDDTFQVVQGGRSQLGIVELDVASGATVCTSTLSSSGNVFSGNLALDAHGTLTVTGTKDGTIPGETGSGTSYVAVYDDLLRAAECPTSPTSVLAF